MSIIAINGKIGSGKDTVGSMIQYLTSKANPYYAFSEYVYNRRLKINLVGSIPSEEWEIKKFAGKLKQIASLLTGIPVQSFEDQEFKKTQLGREWWTKEPNFELGKLVDGTQIMKDYPMTVRDLLQKLGTEALRNGLHTNVWVNALFADYVCRTVAIGTTEFDVIDADVLPNWVITDLRFPNELTAVKERDGITIRITRPGTQVGTHASEIALDNHSFDYEIVNDGSIDELLNKVREILVQEKIIS